MCADKLWTGRSEKIKKEQPAVSSRLFSALGKYLSPVYLGLASLGIQVYRASIAGPWQRAIQVRSGYAQNLYNILDRGLPYLADLHLHPHGICSVRPSDIPCHLLPPCNNFEGVVPTLYFV